MVADAGIDTWSVGWYVQDESPACKALEALATVPAPRSKLLPESVEGHRIGWFPGTRLLFAEGKPSAQGLCKTHELPGAVERLSESLADLGVLPPSHDFRPVSGVVPGGRSPSRGHGFAGVRRLDATVDLRFDSAAAGLAALAGVAALPLPRVKTEVIREVGGRRVETVYLRGSSGRTVLGRWYDKGVESGSAARGMLIRPEWQGRFAKDARPPVDVVAQPSFVRDAFVRRFEPLWRAAKGVKVGSTDELADRLLELQEAGEISASEAKAVAGYLLLESRGANRQSRRTRYRDRRRALDHGLVLADGVDEQLEIDLGEVIEEALEADCWGHG